MLLKRKALDVSSLDFRLMLEVSLLVVLGLGSVAVWTGLKMQQILLTSHTQNIGYIADRFPRELRMYNDSNMFSAETAIQKTIDNVVLPGGLLWAKAFDGRLVAQSKGFDPNSSKTMQLISLAEMPLQPKIYQLADRSFVLYQGLVTINDREFGKIYIAQDVTADQRSLVSMLQGLITICVLVLFVVLFLLRFRILRLLHPLNEMSRFASEISADDLSDVRLNFDRAPSEVKNLAKTFNMLLSRLSESWDRQRQFVGDVSHELRTPLTIVQGYLQSLLRRSQNLTETQREALETAASETERTVRLLQDLLDLARADSGQIRFRISPFLLNELIDEIIGMVRQVSNRTLIVEADILVEVQADRDRLQQVLINLIDNAINYSKADKAIFVRLKILNQKACIQVCDQGVGISLIDRSRVFERFYRVDEARSRTTGGTGLGLSIAKSLVDGMGGELTLQSTLNEGSTFSVFLPLANVVLDQAEL